MNAQLNHILARHRAAELQHASILVKIEVS